MSQLPDPDRYRVGTLERVAAQRELNQRYDQLVLALSPSRAHAPRRSRVSYWQTTPLSAAELDHAIAVAAVQDEEVLAIFRARLLWPAGPALSPSQVWRIGTDHGLSWLLTSVRRSVSNLTDAKVLERCERTVAGPYGRPEGLWRISFA
jgi:hypothetical protein